MKITKCKLKEGWSAEISLIHVGERVVFQARSKTELQAVENLLKDIFQLHREAEKECDKSHNAMLKALRALEL